MTGTEERLRAAFEDAAQTVRQDDLRPLTAPPRTRRAPRRATLRWAAPLVAAASVAVVVAGTLELRDVRHRDTGVVAAPAPPRFFLSMEGMYGKTGRYGQAIEPATVRVRSSATGQVVATMPPIKGVAWYTDQGPVAAPGGRTYLLRGMATDPPGPHELYRAFLVTLGADGTPGRPVEVRIPALRDQPTATALSQDAGYVAFVLGSKVGVADLTTGSVRTWAGADATTALQWTTDGRLLVSLKHGTAFTTRVFDAELRGGKVVGRITIPLRGFSSVAGVYGERYVMWSTDSTSGVATLRLVSAKTGHVIGVLGSWTVQKTSPPTSRPARQPGAFAVDAATGHVLIDDAGRLAVTDLRTLRSRGLPATIHTDFISLGW